jgi:hypothetical protein
VDREDRDVWRLFLEEKNFAAALEHCHDPQQENLVRAAQADALFLEVCTCHQ